MLGGIVKDIHIPTTKQQGTQIAAPLFSRALFKNDYFYLALLTVVVILLFSQFLFSNMMLLASDQLNGIDARPLTNEAFKENFQFPMWRISLLSGMPTIDATIGDIFYFPSLIIHMLFPLHKALGIKLVLHILFAGIAFFFLMRKGFGASPVISFITAAFYMLNPQFLSYVYPGHEGKIYVIAWLPLIILFMKKLMEKPALLTASFLAGSISMALFSSQIQLTYFVLWGLFFYWVFFLVQKWIKERSLKPCLPHIYYFWIAIFAGLGLALIQLLPAFMYVREEFSVRGVDRGFDYAASWSLHWPEFFSLWVPEFVNTNQFYWGENYFKNNSEYTGAMALLFAVFAIVFKPRPWRFFWGGVAVFALLFSLGAHTPVFHAAYYIVPGVKKFRACSMIIFWFSFSVILLCALFFRDIWRGNLLSMQEGRKKRWLRGIGITAGVLTGITLLFSIKGFVAGFAQSIAGSLSDPQKHRVFEYNLSKNFIPYLWLWWFFTMGSLGLLWGLIKGKVNKYLFFSVIVCIGLVDTLRIDTQFIKVISPRQYFYTEPAVKKLSREMEKAPFRSFVLPGTFKTQNVEGVHGLEGINGFHDNELKWYRLFRGEQGSNFYTDLVGGSQGKQYLMVENLEKGNNFLNLANVKYILTRKPDGELIVFQNKEMMKRLSFVSKYVVMEEQEIVNALKNNSYDIRSTVALVEEPQQTPDNNTDSDSQLLSETTVEWEKYTPNFRKATVRVPADGFLRIAEVYYPGWKIKVDGKEVPVYRADAAWMAVNITRGEHVIEMIPQSLYLNQASWVSLPLILLVISYWTAAAIKRKRKKMTQ